MTLEVFSSLGDSVILCPAIKTEIKRVERLLSSKLPLVQRLADHQPVCGGAVWFPLPCSYFFLFPSPIELSLSQPTILPFAPTVFSRWIWGGEKSIFGCLAAGWSQSSTILHSVNDFVWCLPNLRHLQNHITSICYCTILYSVLDVRIHQTGVLSQAAVHVSHHRETAAIRLWKKR